MLRVGEFEQVRRLHTVCIEQQELERAEIIYSQSPSNLLRHLNTDYPAHRAAFDACVEKKKHEEDSSTYVELPAEAREGRRAVSPSYFSVDTSGWHQELVR